MRGPFGAQGDNGPGTGPGMRGQEAVGFHRLSVPYSRGSARTARDALGRALGDLRVPDGVIDDAIVVVSELVTNVVRHAHPDPDGQVGVEWLVDAQRLWLRVSDGGRRQRDDWVHQADAVGGRGLSIVAALADSWDFEPHETGARVTAVFDLE